jgi:hypothetical protein
MVLGFLVALGWVPNKVLGWIVEPRRSRVVPKPRPQRLIHRKRQKHNWNRHHGRASARGSL